MELPDLLSHEEYFVEDERSIDCTVDEALESIGFGKTQWKVFLFIGYHWFAVAMQIVLLSLINNGASCDFNLDNGEATSLTTAAAVGFLVGSLFWGLIADWYGRKPALFCSSLVSLLFGLISAASKSYYELILFRSLATFGVGGNIVSFTLAMELFPKTDRGWTAMCIAIFSACGVFADFLLALFIIPSYGWRLMIIGGSLPMIPTLLLAHEIPESPHWLVVCERTDDAFELLKSIDRQNERLLPFSRIVPRERIENTERKGARVLLSPRIRSLSFKLWVAWFMCGFAYYGGILMQQEMLEQEKSGSRCDYKEEICNEFTMIRQCELDSYCSWKNTTCTFKGEMKTESNISKSDCGKQLTKSEYLMSLVSNTGEIIGLIVVIFVMNVVSRRTILMYMFGISAIAYFLLIPCLSRDIETILYFIISAAAGAYFQVVFLVTSESYPAEVRSSAMGVAAAISRVGLAITPFVSEFLSHPNTERALIVYGLACFFAAAVSVTIPFENNH